MSEHEFKTRNVNDGHFHLNLEYQRVAIEFREYTYRDTLSTRHNTQLNSTKLI